MLKPADFLRDLEIHQTYQSRFIDWLRPWRHKTYVDILIVVDGSISVSPTNSFGISTVIDLIRNKQVGCMKFRVDIASRNGTTQNIVANPTPTQAKYTGFRFDMADGGADVIDKYEQIWCFGFKPSNSGSTNDTEIDLPSSYPTSSAELERLDKWMTEKKGGLFGTGDHHFLGASMCRKIPRLGTMRRWTNANGVPPQGGAGQPNTADRIDTLRPPSNDYQAGGPSSLSNSPHQGDLFVQTIKWATWRRAFWGFGVKKRPHPVLCHPTLGPINKMPDHAHEGLCVPSPNLNANKQFNGEKEYPVSIMGGPKPEPEIIAYGSNLDSDDWNFAKGDQPGRNNNPMIAVYDGHSAGVGRVATDSTWHHWMDVNINNIKAENDDDWKKISRYFINLAVWLNPPGYSTQCFYLAVVASHIQYPGFQEYHHRATTLELGHNLHSHLTSLYGPCWVTERIWDIVWELKLVPFENIWEFREKIAEMQIDPLSFEHIVLGRMVESTYKEAEEMKRDEVEGKCPKVKPLLEPEKLFRKPVADAIKLFAEQVRKDMKAGHDALANFKA